MGLMVGFFFSRKSGIFVFVFVLMEDNVCPGCFKAVNEKNGVHLSRCTMNHYYHPDCLQSGRSSACSACSSSCRLCNEKMDISDSVSMCSVESHLYHKICLTLSRLVAGINPCPICDKNRIDGSLSPPCAICTKIIEESRIRLACGHAVHETCRYEQIKLDRVLGCPVCNNLCLKCPVCDHSMREGHPNHILEECDSCHHLIFDSAFDHHHPCDPAIRCCPRCGNGTPHHFCKQILLGDCIVSNRSLHRVKCPFCKKFKTTLVGHPCFSRKVEPCDLCGWVVSDISLHHSECLGSNLCPAKGCTSVVTNLVLAESARDLSALIRDHDCRNLHVCGACDGLFIAYSDLLDHECSPVKDNSERRTLPRRRAFVKSTAIINNIVKLMQTEE